MNKEFLKEHPILYIVIAIAASVVGYYLYDLLEMLF
jgi:hypothetical protein